MLVAVISDIHDNLANLDIFLRWAVRKQVEELVCCGDVCSLATLSHLSAAFAGPIHLVRGNACLYSQAEAEKLSNVRGGGRIGRWEIGGVLVGACHEPYLLDEVLSAGKCNYVFYGHTHQPALGRRGEVLSANPGTLAGLLNRASFACLDTASGKLSLKIVDCLPEALDASQSF